jgi:hypothetical protein
MGLPASLSSLVNQWQAHTRAPSEGQNSCPLSCSKKPGVIYPPAIGRQTKWQSLAALEESPSHSGKPPRAYLARRAPPWLLWFDAFPYLGRHCSAETGCAPAIWRDTPPHPEPRQCPRNLTAEIAAPTPAQLRLLSASRSRGPPHCPRRRTQSPNQRPLRDGLAKAPRQRAACGAPHAQHSLRERARGMHRPPPRLAAGFCLRPC